MMRRTLRFVLSAVAVVACTLVLRADDQITAGDAELQFQLGNLLSDETRYREALDAFDKAIHTDDASLTGQDQTTYGNHLSLSKARALRVALAMQEILGFPASVIESAVSPINASARREGSLSVRLS